MAYLQTVTMNRLGGVGVEFRGGYAYKPKAVSGIGKNMTMIDASRQVYCLGFGIEQQLTEQQKRLTISSAAQLHRFASGDLEVLYDQGAAGAPIDGVSIPVQGSIRGWTVQGGMDF